MNAVARSGVSIALACRTFQVSETCYRYSPVLSDENEEIADWLERLTANKRNWGFGLCFLAEIIDSSFHRVQDVKSHLDLPVLMSIPTMEIPGER